MKNIGLVIFLMGFLSLTACGPSQDDPEKKYRDAGFVPVGSSGAATGNEKQKVVVIQEIPVEVKEYYPEEEPELVVNENLFQITHNELTFVEGESKSFDVQVKITQGDVKFKVEGVMQGATLTSVKEEVNHNTYKVTYKPTVGSIPGNDYQISGVFKFRLTNLQFVSKEAKINENTKAAFDAISKTREVPFRIIRTNKKPSIKVVGLDNKTVINEGSIVPFTVDVTAPGGYTGNEPELRDFYSRRNAITENGFEAKGQIYIEENPNKPRFEKVNDNTWRFHYVVNAKDYPVLPPLDKEMKPVVNAQKLFLRTTFVASTQFTPSSDEKLVQFAITLKPKAAATAAGEKQ